MERYVRISHTLNEAEKKHLSGRRPTVQQCLAWHNIHCDVEKVPNIAVMGSGGGERAMVGLLGSILKLGEANLLDCMMYLSGVSGSTWGMASLYKYDNWSRKGFPELEVPEITSRLGGPKVEWGASWNKWQKYRWQWDNYSNTEWWAAYMVPTYIKEIDETVLSDQRGYHDEDPYPIYTIIDQGMTKRKPRSLKDETVLSDQRGYHDEDPYPIYTIIDQGMTKRKPRSLKDVWVEMTPHESGYSLTGAFVDHKFFGSKFYKGDMIKEQPEMDMLYVQGICGSAAASSASQQYEAWSTLKEVAKREFGDKESCLACEVLHSLIELNLAFWAEEGQKDYSDLAVRMNTLLKGKLDKKGEPFFINPDVLILDKSVQMEKLRVYTLSVCDCFSDWNKGCKVAPEMWAFMITAIQGILTWGDTYNFLQQMRSQDVDRDILMSETRNYIDAGLLLNSPYFSVLRKERNVDLIISLDFSGGDAMMTIDDAQTMAKEMGIDFPDVRFPIDARNTPEDFYVFPGDGNCPTVIHMPLFNLVNCGSADQIEEWRNRYKTMQLSYSPEMIHDLLEKAGENVTNNKDRLLEEIKNAVDRRRS